MVSPMPLISGSQSMQGLKNSSRHSPFKSIINGSIAKRMLTAGMDMRTHSQQERGVFLSHAGSEMHTTTLSLSSTSHLFGGCGRKQAASLLQMVVMMTKYNQKVFRATELSHRCRLMCPLHPLPPTTQSQMTRKTMEISTRRKMMNHPNKRWSWKITRKTEQPLLEDR